MGQTLFQALRICGRTRQTRSQLFCYLQSRVVGRRGIINDKQGNRAASQVALAVRNLLAKAGDVRQVQSLGQEDPLEEGRATHSSILAWEIPWREEAGGLQSLGLQSVRTRLK